VLKKSVFLKTAKISGIENVCPRRERRLWGFLTQSLSGHFPGGEFFNSHKRLHQLFGKGSLLRWVVKFFDSHSTLHLLLAFHSSAVISQISVGRRPET
jgi:hypothetical protein